jgi:hypothetical protein
MVEQNMIEGKRMYKAPENADEALEVIRNAPTRTFAKLKGRGLTIIESWWDKNDSRLNPAKSLFNTMIADVCNELTKQLEDSIKFFEKTES